MRPTFLMLPLLAITCTADVMDLAGGGRLKGTVQSISSDGVIIAKLEVADEPVELLADKVTRVKFISPKERYDHDSMLVLANGDRLPCDLSSISASHVTVETGYSGELLVPRPVIRTIQLGIRPRKTIFAGPENLKTWKFDDNWHFEEDSLVSDGRGSISREFEDLPDSFSISFRVKWADRPMFKFYFSSPQPRVSGDPSDRYLFEVGTSGISVKRQSKGAAHFHSLISASRAVDAITEREATFELRFDRRQRRLMLYIDDQLEGQAADPLDVIPEGKHVIFHSDSSNAEAHRVSQIAIREWDAAGERHRSEDRGDFGEDALINNNGERWGGQLVSTKSSGDGMLILFKSPLAPDALEVPVSDVSTLFLKEPESKDDAATPVVLGLVGSGSLGAEACTFGPDTVELTHPLLGPLELNRNAIQMLQRREWPENADHSKNSKRN